MYRHLWQDERDLKTAAINIILHTGRIAAGILWLCSLSGCTLLSQQHTLKVQIEGVEDRGLKKTLLKNSEAWRQRRHNGIPVEELEQTYRADRIQMERFLHATGHLAARVRIQAEPVGKRRQVVFHVTEPTVFPIRAVLINGMPPGLDPPSYDALIGEAADAGRINRYAQTLLRSLHNGGYPDAFTRRKAKIADFEKQNTGVLIEIDAGPKMIFGGLSVHGLHRVDPAFFDRRVTWTPETPYQAQALNEFRQRVGDSGLFSYMEIRRNPTSSNGVYEVELKVKERKPRTIGLGVGYRTDLGPEVGVDWQHRNLFGMGERFELSGRYSQDLWLGNLTYTIPEVLRTRNDLSFGIETSEEDSDAYFVRYTKIYSELHHRVGKKWNLFYGPAQRRSWTTQAQEDHDYNQISFPSTTIWTDRNHPLNPSSGSHVVFRMEPTVDLISGVPYITTLISPAHYFALVDAALVLAARVTVGSIAGASLEDVPADLRFYAGGGQSVRGYSYQAISPRENGQAVGGLSLLETSLELRWTLKDKFGLVGFLDGGSAYDPQLADFDESYQWGAGLGFRYMTGVGPIRFDVGLPVNPREGIDRDYEFYISIGQAF